MEDCGKTRNSTIIPVEGVCENKDILDKSICLGYDEVSVNVNTRTNNHRHIARSELGRCKPADSICANSQKPVSYTHLTLPTLCSV